MIGEIVRRASPKKARVEDNDMGRHPELKWSGVRWSGVEWSGVK